MAVASGGCVARLQVRWLRANSRAATQVATQRSNAACGGLKIWSKSMLSSPSCGGGRAPPPAARARCGCAACRTQPRHGERRTCRGVDGREECVMVCATESCAPAALTWWARRLRFQPDGSGPPSASPAGPSSSSPLRFPASPIGSSNSLQPASRPPCLHLFRWSAVFASHRVSSSQPEPSRSRAAPLGMSLGTMDLSSGSAALNSKQIPLDQSRNMRDLAGHHQAGTAGCYSCIRTAPYMRTSRCMPGAKFTTCTVLRTTP